MNEKKIKHSRTGIFGGTFNPIHTGHLICSEEVREKYALDNIVFIPSAVPPHKESSDIIDPLLRYEMVKLGIKDNPLFEASDIEIKSPGKSYSIDTLKKIIAAYTDRTAFFFIMGLDAFIEIETWKSPGDLITLCHFIVMLRPGISQESLFQRLPEFIKRRIKFNIEKGEAINYNNLEKNIILVPVTGISISSTGIRERISQGKSIKYLVPHEVESFIRNKNLYKGAR